MGERVGNAGSDHLRSPMKRALMRDFRDAKAMAHTLRDALKAKAVETTHSECLELIAKTFGCENWNVLSARIEATQSPGRTDGPPVGSDRQLIDAHPSKPLTCSFCGKTQHEVKKLIAGPPPMFVCDECVGLCNEIIDEEEFLNLFSADDARGDQPPATAIAYLRGRSTTDQLTADAGRINRGAERCRLAVQQIARMLVLPEDAAERDALLPPGFAFLKGKTSNDIAALAQRYERSLKQYEDARRMVATVLGERAQSA
jgi:hypothetical protein